MELTLLQAWLILFSVVLIFLSGLCWCFCCGTCIGRSMLRNTGLVKFTRDDEEDRYWYSHVPLQTIDEEEEEL
ncbi:hypothetical protein AB4K20DRAFT_1892251 [Rhizopus microsporus]